MHVPDGRNVHLDSGVGDVGRCRCVMNSIRVCSEGRIEEVLMV